MTSRAASSGRAPRSFTGRFAGEIISRVEAKTPRPAPDGKAAPDAIGGQPSLKESVTRLRAHARDLAGVREELRAAPQRVEVDTRPLPPDLWADKRVTRHIRALAWLAAAVATSAAVGASVAVLSKGLG